MALQSQSRRAGLSRSSDSFHRSRRSEEKRLLGYLLLTLVVCGIVLYAWQSRATGPRTADAHTTDSSTNLAGANKPAPSAAPATSSAPAQTQPPPIAPLVMEMGSKRGASKPEPLLASPTPDSAQPASSAAQRPASVAFAPDDSPAPTPPTVKDPLVAPPNSSPAPPPELATSPSHPDAPASGPLADAQRLIAQNKPLDARALLNRALADQRTPEPAREEIRRTMAALNQSLVFSPVITPGDPLAFAYSVASGDALVKIARRQSLNTEPTLIARINRLANPNALRVGQSLKLLRGPFHAVVHKSDFRLDLYAGPTPPAPAPVSADSASSAVEPGWTFIRSFTVGLGERGSTPTGLFVVKDNSKLVNPYWVNPRTGEKFDADDPKNPIGERWVGLEGLDAPSKAFTGYGVHGTVEPDSIGRELSMGCVRMNAEDVEAVYDFLMPRVSIVKIVP